MLEVRMLGQFDVRIDGETIEIPSRPAQSLLAYLMLNAGTLQRREKLAGLFWPDASEENARSNLRHALWRLRKAIGDEHLQADKISIAFREDSPYWLDAHLLVDDADDARTSEDLIRIASAFGGELLPGFYDDWVVLERERLRTLFEYKAQMLLERLVEEMRWADVLEWGERWIALGHVPEPAYRALMLAHAGFGDLASVAAVYKRCQQVLREELDVEPSEETRKTYQWLKEGGGPAAFEQPFPQKEDRAVYALLARWREREIEVLDLASLAIVQACPTELHLQDEDTHLLIRSALHHGIEIEPWLARARTPVIAVSALADVLESYPKPRIRRKIVRALDELETAKAEEVLFRVGTSDDAGEVRAEAAVAVAKRGKRSAVVQKLVEELNTSGGSAAMAAFVAVADEVGLPPDVGPHPRLPLGLALAQRRWKAHKREILRQLGKASIAGALAMGAVATLQLVPTAILTPGEFQETLQFVPLPIWVISNALMGFLWGGIQGVATGLLVGCVDAFARNFPKRKWRLGVAGATGLVHSAFLILLTVIGGFNPAVGPSIYVPIYLLYGFLVGGALSLVIPPIGSFFPTKLRLIRSLWASFVIMLVALPAVYGVYRAGAGSAIILHFMYAILFPLGLGFAFGEEKKGSDLDRSRAARISAGPSRNEGG